MFLLSLRANCIFFVCVIQQHEIELHLWWLLFLALDFEPRISRVDPIESLLIDLVLVQVEGCN